MVYEECPVCPSKLFLDFKNVMMGLNGEVTADAVCKNCRTQVTLAMEIRAVDREE